MKYALFIMLISLLSSSSVPLSSNRELSLPGQSQLNQLENINLDNSSGITVEQINQSTDLLDFGQDSVSKTVNSKTWSKCTPGVKIPWTGIKIQPCGEIEVGYVYIKFCGKLGNWGRKCLTYKVWDSKEDCQTLISVGSSLIGISGLDVFIKVCPYNIKISKTKISTNVQFKLCGDVPFFDAKCTTFWSQSISYKP